jgi:hypothetical protein
MNSSNASMPPAPPPAPPAPKVFTSGELTFGIIIGLCGAALLAFSMNVQRHALSYPEKSKAPLFPRCDRGPLLPRIAVWIWGLVLYGVWACACPSPCAPL